MKGGEAMGVLQGGMKLWECYEGGDEAMGVLQGGMKLWKCCEGGDEAMEVLQAHFSLSPFFHMPITQPSPILFQALYC